MARVVGNEENKERVFEVAFTDEDFAALYDIVNGFKVYVDNEEMTPPLNVQHMASFLMALEEDTRP